MQETKISDELLKKIQEKLPKNPDESIHVIVSLNDGVDVEAARKELSTAELKVDRVIPGPVKILAGDLQAKLVSELAKKK
jgi:hypothetical protein